jgi:hypothetical protein
MRMPVMLGDPRCPLACYSARCRYDRQLPPPRPDPRHYDGDGCDGGGLRERGASQSDPWDRQWLAAGVWRQRCRMGGFVFPPVAGRVATLARRALARASWRCTARAAGLANGQAITRGRTPSAAGPRMSGRRWTCTAPPRPARPPARGLGPTTPCLRSHSVHPRTARRSAGWPAAGLGAGACGTPSSPARWPARARGEGRGATGGGRRPACEHRARGGAGPPLCVVLGGGPAAALSGGAAHRARGGRLRGPLMGPAWARRDEDSGVGVTARHCEAGVSPGGRCGPGRPWRVRAVMDRGPVTADRD